MDTPAPAQERESSGFKIQRSNLRKIAKLKEKLKALEKTTSTNTDKSTNKDTSTTTNKNRTKDATTATATSKSKQNPYEKRKPLNEKEKSLLATSGTKATAITQDETHSSKSSHESTTNKARHRKTASRADGCGCG